MFEQPNLATARASKAKDQARDDVKLVSSDMAFAAWLPLERVSKIDPDALRQSVEVLLEDDTEVTIRKLSRDLGRSGKAGYEVVVSGIRIGVVLKARRVADAKVMEEFVNPLDWPDGNRVLARHRAHVSIKDWSASDLPDTDGAYNRAVAVTVVTMALLDQVDPLCVLWHPARNAVPVDRFIDEVEKTVAGTPATRLWVRWAREKGDGDRLLTHGLAALIGREIELECGRTAYRKCIDPLLDLSAGLVEMRLELHDGAVLSGGPFPVEIRHKPIGAFGVPAYVVTPAPDMARSAE